MKLSQYFSNWESTYKCFISNNVASRIVNSCHVVLAKCKHLIFARDTLQIRFRNIFIFRIRNAVALKECPPDKNLNSSLKLDAGISSHLILPHLSRNKACDNFFFFLFFCHAHTRVSRNPPSISLELSGACLSLSSELSQVVSLGSLPYLVLRIFTLDSIYIKHVSFILNIVKHVPFSYNVLWWNWFPRASSCFTLNLRSDVKCISA